MTDRPTAIRPVLDVAAGDIVRLRRPHACGGSEWLVDRLGADIGLRCTACGRHVLLERRHLETRLKTFVSRTDRTASASPGPTPAPEA